MGVKHLNRYFLANCSPSSIQKINFEACRNKTVVIDTSIYLYKFITEKDAYMEQLYLFLSIFLSYQITPIFIFDGKSPPEKNDLVKRRYQEKKQAESKYDELQIQLLAHEKDSKEYIQICEQLEELRKRMVRLRSEHIQQAKELMDAFAFTYYDAVGESDQLCAYFVQTGIAWACLSDDMDLFLLNCPRVLRGISLMNHTWTLYHTDSILKDMNMTVKDLIQIVSLSHSTDYMIDSAEKSQKGNERLKELFALYKEYTEIVPNPEQIQEMSFYTWYLEREKVPTEKIEGVCAMFDICASVLEPFRDVYRSTTKTSYIQMAKIKQIMRPSGFIFLG